MRSGVSHLRLRNRRGMRRKPTFAALPLESRFSGRSYIVVADTRRLPARLTADGTGERTVVRIPRRSVICRAGGEPFVVFESRR